MNLFPVGFQRLEQSMNAATTTQRVISANIANQDTPNYKAKEVVFQSELQKAVQNQSHIQSFRTHDKHIPFSIQGGPIPQPRIVVNNKTIYNHNGNNVDVDYEMAQLAKNQMMYDALKERVNGHFNSLRTVITEGR